MQGQARLRMWSMGGANIVFEEALFEWPETETGNLKKPEEETSDKKKKTVQTFNSFFSHIY